MTLILMSLIILSEMGVGIMKYESSIDSSMKNTLSGVAYALLALFLIGRKCSHAQLRIVLNN